MNAAQRRLLIEILGEYRDRMLAHAIELHHDGALFADNGRAEPYHRQADRCTERAALCTEILTELADD